MAQSQLRRWFFGWVVLSAPLAAQAGLVSVTGTGASWSEQILKDGSPIISSPGGPQLPAIDSGIFMGGGFLGQNRTSVGSFVLLDIGEWAIDGTVSTTYGDNNLADTVTGLGESLIDFSFELDTVRSFTLFSSADSLVPNLGSVLLKLDGFDLTPALGGNLFHSGILGAGFHTITAQSLTPTIVSASPSVLTSLDFQLRFDSETTAVPEPTAWALLSVAAAIGAGGRHWRNRATRTESHKSSATTS